MINSILDTDLYKLSMSQAIAQKYPNAWGRYRFINRDNREFPKGFAESLKSHVLDMKRLRLTRNEKNFLKESCPYFTPAFLDFLEGYRFDPSEVSIYQNGVGALEVTVTGPWYRTVFWEVPLMALISEIYFQLTKQEPTVDVDASMEDKVVAMKIMQLPYADFGTRRRYSYRAQSNFLDIASERGGSRFLGTSNVHFAHLYGLKPIGTHAHEWFMFHGAMFGYKAANAMALDAWSDVYNGRLGIALTDTYTTDAFFKDFDSKRARLYDGVRHDSGDPLAFADKVWKHYESLGIDPETKTIIFSDGLNPKKAHEIAQYCSRPGYPKFAFGIGTNLTNDVGVNPLNIVIKLVQCKARVASSGLHADGWLDCVKLSDVEGKNTGSPREVKLCKSTLGLPPARC